MVTCRLDQGTLAKRRPARIETALALRRLFVFVGTALLTAAGGYEMDDVLKVGGGTGRGGILLAFFLLPLAWIAFSFLSRVALCFVLVARPQDWLAVRRNRAPSA